MAGVRLKAQLLCGGETAFGPGKADLLDSISRTGSISAAGRAMGMSYRRAWLLVDTMNRCWHERLVETSQGGGRDRGARLTPTGRDVLAAYRRLEAGIAAAAARELETLAPRLRETPRPAAKGGGADASPTAAPREGKNPLTITG